MPPPPFCASLALAGLSALFLSSCATAPSVRRETTSAPVTLTQDEGAFTLSNGIVAARIDKKSGEMLSLIYKGIDTMGHDQGHSGVWEENPSRAELVGGLSQRVTIDPAGNGGERAEIAIKGVTKGDPKAGLSPNSPGAAASGMTNCDLELRYALGRGESGIYTYAIFSHPAAYGPLNVPESRFITFLSQRFDWLSVDADRNLLECAPLDWGTGVPVHAKEQRIMSQGLYRNSVEHKYSYTGVQYQTPAYGWSSTRDHIGIWFVNPSIEYLSGGPTKLELDCHYGDNGNPDPIILDYWRGTHYGVGAPCRVAAGEDWNKVVGPIFIYVDSLDHFQAPSPADLAALQATAGDPTMPAAWQRNASALWQDALRQARDEKAKWPYDWVQGVDYPHRDERATVTGQIVLDDPQAATTKLPHLLVGLAHPDGPPLTFTGSPGVLGPRRRPPGAGANAPASNSLPNGISNGRRFGGFRRLVLPQDWVHDSKHYQFWNGGALDGRFTIANVRPGTYTLHAFADGVLGEFAQTKITVAAGQTLDLGRLDWKPVRYGRQVWEIGYPDRTGGKFFKGDGADYWLWGWCLRYPLLFPHDITYTIGQSDYHKDWFFEQVPHGESTAWLNPGAKDPANQRFGWVKAGAQGTTGDFGPWRLYGRGRATTWTIKFDLGQESQGVAALRIALAGADTSELDVAVNGRSAGAIHPTITNAIRYNTDKGVWQEQTLKFDAALLRTGENSLQLTVPAGDLTSGVVYDYLRLELDPSAKPAGPPAAVARN
ncbi:MAG TPA: polysaccharide lyase family protein [Opitutaceae bacterium]|nr:polysaccharide lyase family protein [Opitutaceae bacterium]